MQTPFMPLQIFYLQEVFSLLLRVHFASFHDEDQMFKVQIKYLWINIFLVPDSVEGESNLLRK